MSSVAKNNLGKTIRPLPSSYLSLPNLASLPPGHSMEKHVEKISNLLNLIVNLLTLLLLYIVDFNKASVYKNPYEFWILLRIIKLSTLHREGETVTLITRVKDREEHLQL